MSLLNRTRSNGPVIDYLTWLYGTAKAAKDPETVESVRIAIHAIRRLAKSDDGKALFAVLDKSVNSFVLPPSTETRALEAHNAQAFILVDLQRIANGLLDPLLEDTGSQPGRRRRGRNNDAG